MADINLTDYYNRFDPEKKYDNVLFRADRTLQSAEMNEIQSISRSQIRGIGDALLKDGNIIRDCRVSIDEHTGVVQCESGAIYMAGSVRGVPPATLTVPTTGTIAIGVYLHERIVTELEDPTLYNPAIGTRGEGEEGAARLQVYVAWGFSGDGQDGVFCPVYTVDDGALHAKEAPPNLDSVTQALARYDRDSAGGTYVVEGLTVLAAEDAEDGRQVYTINEGRARVFGYLVELLVSRRLTRLAKPDLLPIDSEPHMSTGAAAQRVTLDRYPVGKILQVRITKETTATVTHGGFTGSQDPLPDTSVVEIIEVKQGGVTYTSPADYKLTAGKVDWTPSGVEPAPHSTYTVKYRHISTEEPTSVDLSGFTVTGAVAGSQILVNYTQMLTRLDRLCITRDGEFVWVEGVAAEWNPQPPRVPEGMLAIATVYQTWDASRRVVNDGVSVVPMDKIAALDFRMDDILAQVAQQRLTSDIVTREAGAKKGLFVDPCLSDDMRDQGLAQTAAIVGGVLTLPVDIDVIARVNNDINAPKSKTFTLQKVLEQILRTGSMLVNPYHAFAPLPAIMSLSPSVDRWTDVQSNWATPVTEVFNGGHWVPGRSTLVATSANSTTQTLASSTSNLANLRQIDVTFRGAGFARNEIVDVSFDGIPIATSVNKADDSGVFAGSFRIPANVPAGSKQVLFVGRGGTRGSAVFVGQGQLTVQTLRTVTTTVLTWHDPLAQTFVLNEACQIGAVDLWFTARGTSNVVVQIRETTVGMPNQTVLGEQVLAPAELILGNSATRVTFKAPVMLQPDTEYALVVMCDDATTALSIAEIGKSDPWYGRWVTSQPYQVGVLLSSSNASTWTPHQDRDMTFRLLKAVYGTEPLNVPLGNVEVHGATDLILMSVTEQPAAATRVEYDVTLPDTSVLTMTDMQPVRFAQPITGPVSVTAKLTGTQNAAPVLYPGTQVLTGITAQSADYISRAVPAGPSSRVRVIIDALLPAGAGVTVKLGEDGQSTWTNAPFVSSRPLDEGWQELVYEGATNALLVRSKLVLTGNVLARPCVANIRVLTI